MAQDWLQEEWGPQIHLTPISTLILRIRAWEPFLTVSPVSQPASTCLFSYLSEPADAPTEGSLALGSSLSSPLSINPSPTVTAWSLPSKHGIIPNCPWTPLTFGVPVLLVPFLKKMNEEVKQHEPPSRHDVLFSGILSPNPRCDVFFSSTFCPQQQSNKNLHLDSMLIWNLKSLALRGYAKDLCNQALRIEEDRSIFT